MKKRVLPALLLTFVAIACTGGDDTKSTETQEPKTGSNPSSASAGSGLYGTCIACHGENGSGNVTLFAPTIANQEDWYLERQLNNFVRGIRGGDPSDVNGYQMASMAKILGDDADFKSLAKYITSLPPVIGSGTIEGDVENGKVLYAMTCGACHGPNAEGNKLLNAPNLSGLNDWYILDQYKKFKEGKRGSHPDDLYGSQMMAIAQATVLDEESLKDLAAYIVSNGR